MNFTLKQRPILFSGPMVRARKTQTRRIIKGVNPYTTEIVPVDVDERFRGATQKERDAMRSLMWESRGPVCLDRPDAKIVHYNYFKCPFGVSGDQLWVRESWSAPEWADGNSPVDLGKTVPIYYHADKSHGALVRWNADEEIGKTRVSIHMPQWMNRITLQTTNIRAQRLNDISESDAIAEGIERFDFETVTAWKNYLFKTSHPSGSIKGYFDPVRSYQSLWDSINGKKYPWESNPWVWAVCFPKIGGVA